jgi:hypothetical protein
LHISLPGTKPAEVYASQTPETNVSWQTEAAKSRQSGCAVNRKKAFAAQKSPIGRGPAFFEREAAVC